MFRFCVPAYSASLDSSFVSLSPTPQTLPVDVDVEDMGWACCCLVAASRCFDAASTLPRRCLALLRRCFDAASTPRRCLDAIRPQDHHFQHGMIHPFHWEGWGELRWRVAQQ